MMGVPIHLQPNSVWVDLERTTLHDSREQCAAICGELHQRAVDAAVVRRQRGYLSSGKCLLVKKHGY
jgi:hypothetical protein